RVFYHTREMFGVRKAPAVWESWYPPSGRAFGRASTQAHVISGPCVDYGVRKAAPGIGRQFDVDVPERAVGPARRVIGQRVAPADALQHVAKRELGIAGPNHIPAGLFRQMVNISGGIVRVVT